MTANRMRVNGDRNVQLSGNDNIVAGGNVLIQMSRSPLTHSLIHDLLDIVYSLPAPVDESYSLKDPAPINDKLKFNNARKYISIIENHADDYSRLDDVMKDYPNSEDIVKKLRDMFIIVADLDVDGSPCVGDGDTQLDQIKLNLFETIVNDSNFDVNKYPSEKIEQFCVALIAYGVSKCKILVVPVQNASVG